MNERIKQLANQAGYNDLIYEISKEGLDKFAQLIIADVVEQTKKDLMKWLAFQVYSGSSHRTFDMGFAQEPDWLNMDEMTKYMPQAIDEVKQHFES